MKLDFFASYKKHFLENCTQCGRCAAMCPVIKETEISNISSRTIQQSLFKYMNDGKQNNIVYTRAYSCQKCFKCTINTCPKELNPMLVNEIIFSEYTKLKDSSQLHQDVYKDHKILSRTQTSIDEYKRITTPINKKAQILFFPGCNVYIQPEKILNTLDILDKIGKEYSFMPGIEHCCGDRCYGSGEMEMGITLTNSLFTAIEEYQPKVLLLWCSTCHCRLTHYIDGSHYKDIKIMSVHEYILDNFDSLSFVGEKMKITLHEACKASFTGVDNDAPRKLLQKIPTLELIEMKHHGKNTHCCGSNTSVNIPTIFNKLLHDRIDEIEQTNAQQVVAVCHFCELHFFLHEEKHLYTTTNIISLIAKMVGIKRENKLRNYVLSKDMRALLPNTTHDFLHTTYFEDEIKDALKRILT